MDNTTLASMVRCTQSGRGVLVSDVKRLYRPLRVKRSTITAVYVALLLAVGTVGISLRSAGVVGVVAFGAIAAVSGLWILLRLWHMTLSMALLLMLVAGTTAYGKQFSYLHFTVGDIPLWITESVVGDIPLWITESVMAGMAVFLIVRQMVQGRLRVVRSALNWPILLLILWGAVGLMRGVSSHGLQAMRDFAITYYAVFYFLTVAVVRTRTDLKALMVAFLLGSLVASLLTVRGLIGGSGFQVTYVDRYAVGWTGLYAATSIIACLCLLRWTKMRSLVALLIPLNLVVVLLGQQRSLWIALAVGLVVLLRLDRKRVIVDRVAMWKIAMLVVAVAVLIVDIALLVGSDGGLVEYLDQSLTRFRGMFTYGTDPTGTWRLAGWAEAARRFLQRPLIGEGLGGSFSWVLPDGRRVEVAPHNTFLTVLVKMGLLGLGLLLWVNLVFYRRALRSFRALESDGEKMPLLWSLVSHAMFSVYGFFNLLLESPFLALFYWVFMGAVVAADRLGRRSMRAQAAKAGPTPSPVVQDARGS